MARPADKRALSMLLAATLLASVYGGGDAVAAARQLSLEADELTALAGWKAPDRELLSRWYESLAETARTLGGFDTKPALAAMAELGRQLPDGSASAIFTTRGRTACFGLPVASGRFELIDLPPPARA